jgi:hypothetical protein
MSYQFILGWLLVQFLNTNAKPTVENINGPSIVPTVPSLIVSADGGDTWQGMSTGLPEEIMLRTILATETNYYLGTSIGLFSGRLPAPEWQKETFRESFVTGLFHGKQGPYAISSWNGIYQYRAISKQWIQIDQDLKDKSSHTVLETQQGHLYTGSESGIYQSTDHGKSWKHVFDPGPIHFFAEIDGVIFAGGSHRLWRSEDGKTWIRTMNPDLFPAMISTIDDAVITITSGPEFAGYRPANEVMLSSDNGANWKRMFTSLPKSLHSINDLKKIGDVLFACSSEGIFRSSDAGSTWEHIVALPADNKGNFYKLYVNGHQLIALRMSGC